jgi:hypothetical protein
MEEQKNLYDWIDEDNTTTKVNQKKSSSIHSQELL